MSASRSPDRTTSATIRRCGKFLRSFDPPFVIPAQAGLRRQDAEANIGEADGPKGAPQERRVIQCLSIKAKALDSGSRLRRVRNDDWFLSFRSPANHANFLYFTRCGFAASSPRRRFLSASYSL